MKILFVSMPSLHVIRWIENLKDTDYELYWFDVLGKGKLDTIGSVNQITNWKKRKIPYIKGEFWLRKKFPNFYSKIQYFLEITPNEQLETIIKEIKPNIIHSFEMQSCSYPILKTMNKFPNLKWIYFCWGNDLFYYLKINFHKSKINKVLQRVNYLLTDCERDHQLAIKNGFVGKYLGVIPGGTGFNLEVLKKLKQPVSQRNIILIKGYQHKFGRAINVIKAIQQANINLSLYTIVIFGAHDEVIAYVANNNLPYQVYDRHGLSHQELLELMGKSLIYIGNNISDGMPNTLLEAIVMGAFPIQSNPGNVTSEIIQHKKNGLLIEDPDNVDVIQEQILFAINNPNIIYEASHINNTLAIQKLDYSFVQHKILNLYPNILN